VVHTCFAWFRNISCRISHRPHYSVLASSEFCGSVLFLVPLSRANRYCDRHRHIQATDAIKSEAFGAQVTRMDRGDRERVGECTCPAGIVGSDILITLIVAGPISEGAFLQSTRPVDVNPSQFTELRPLR